MSLINLSFFRWLGKRVQHAVQLFSFLKISSPHKLVSQVLQIGFYTLSPLLNWAGNLSLLELRLTIALPDLTRYCNLIMII